MKHFWRLNDTTILMISLTSGVVHLSIIAFSTEFWHLYLSITIGMLANLTLPTLKSFTAQLVEPDEVGKAFTVTGVAADLAFVSSTLVFNNIYKATVTVFAGFVFLFAAGLLIVCLFIVIYIAKTDDRHYGDDGKMTEKSEAVTKKNLNYTDEDGENLRLNNNDINGNVNTTKF